MEIVLNEIKEKTKNSISDLKAEDYAKEKGLSHRLAEDSGEIKTNQLRKFYENIKEIERKTKGEKILNKEKIYLLMPQLAYSLGRRLINKNFYDVMKYFIENVKSIDDYKVFVKFYEAMIAYSKMPKENKGGR